MSDNNSNRVKVGVRVRPLSSHELDDGATNVLSCRQSSIQANVPSKSTRFDFDWVFGEKSPQSDLYTAMCTPLIDNLFLGFNATVFAYGQTGSGKTYTMGNAADGSLNEGVIPFAGIDR